MTETVALLAPTAVGIKVTVMVQLPPAATLVPHVLVCEKSLKLAPTMVIEVMVKVALPVFVSVTFMGLLEVPTAVAGNVRLVGEKVTAGPTPVPDSATFCGLMGALSVTSTFALRVPEAVGVNVTLMVQLPPAATLLPQVLV